MASDHKNPAVVFTQKLQVPNAKIDISYPVVAYLPDPAAQMKINNDILMLVYKLIAMQYARLSSQGISNPDVSMTALYEIKTNERGVLSLALTNYAIAMYEAHGVTFMKSLNFDTTTGKNHLLSEEFKPGSDYVKTLSDIIKVQIKERGIPLVNGFDSIRPDQDYYISDQVLVIYIQMGEIAPDSYGILTFPIPLYQIQDMIQDGSLLDRVAAGV